MLAIHRRKWETFVGIPQNQAADLFKGVLSQNKIPFKEKRRPPFYMYDSMHESILLETDDMTITLIYVSGDPLTRFFSGVIGSRKYFEGITFLSVTYSDNKRGLRQLLTDFHELCQTPPWIITHHPRFQFAYLLQAKNRLKWKRMCILERD